MMRIRKAFNVKIAVVAVSILLLFNRTAYPSLSRDSLRVEMNRKDVYEDIKTAQKISLLARYKAAIGERGKKILTKFWTPKERRYNFLTSYIGDKDKDTPFDDIFTKMNELNRLREEGNDISEAVENLKREVASDKKLKSIKRISMISMIHNLYSNDSTKIYKGLKLIPGVLHDTGYVALAIPQNRSYIIGKEVKAIGIKTPNTGNIDIGICTTLLESKGEGMPAGVADKNISKVFLFFNRLDESYIVHETAHMISDRIKSEQRGVRSERLAKLAELLNQRYNGRDVGEIFSYLEELAVDKLAHDIADEENFIALYEIKTGIKMPALDVAKIKDALRGVSPSEIAGLAEEAIRRGGFFDQESEANIFIEDVKVCVKAANAFGALFMESIIEPMYKNRPSVPLPYQLNLFMLYTYFNSLKAAREGRLNESAEFIKEMITYYFDGKESFSQTIIQAINLSNVDNLSQKDLRNIKSSLKNRNVPILLGYFVAAWVEVAEEAIRVHQVEKSKKNGDNSNLSVLSGKKTVRDAI